MTTLTTLPYRQLSNDLYSDLQCVNPECREDKYGSDSVLANYPRRVKFVGYNDAYFFDVVNAESRELTCKCGQKYTYRWTRSGVKVSPEALPSDKGHEV